MSAPSPKKSLKDRVKSARFAYRDVALSLDAELVIERENALAEVAVAAGLVRDASRALEQGSADVAPDERMGQKPAFVGELEQGVNDAVEMLNEARAKVDELEAAMVDDMVTLRFSAVSKQRFIAIREEYESPAEVYSALARESGKYVNGDTVEVIDGELWDMLEEALTAGQWEQIVAALDEVNITLAVQRHGFLARGSKKTQG